ncbi:hypothetical protein TKK_0008318 [Trichogramma kaykai]
MSTFTSLDVSRFCNEAPDEKYLLHKAVLVVAVSGACRKEELANLTLDDVEDVDQKILLINILHTKTGVERLFTVAGDFYKICKQFMELRPKDCSSNRFFVNYRNGKCVNQPIGINQMNAIPKVIASFLNLSNPELFTAQSFRRTALTRLVEAGSDMTMVKKLGGWPTNSRTRGLRNH